MKIRSFGWPFSAAALVIFSGSVGACSQPIDAGATSDAQSAQEVAAVPSCDARAYGAKGDGVTSDTKAIQAAIDACAGKGGEVHLQNGTFLSGTIRLKSSMTFHIHGGATLEGSLADADYPDTNPPTNNSQLSNCKKALLYAESAKDLHITGTGIIDGRGQNSKWTNSALVERQRPMAIFIVSSQNVSIENVTVKNSAMWSVVNMETDDLLIRDVTVNSTNGGTRDGLDIVDCHHVTIDDCTISSEDDSICLKSGVARGVDDVTVKNSHVLTSGVANALKLGTASYGPFTNITFDTIDVQHADKAAMAVESVDGSLIKNVTFKNISFSDVGTPFFVLIGDRGVRPAHTAKTVGSIDGITFENIHGVAPRHDWGAVISGLEENGKSYRVSNVLFQDVFVTGLGGMKTVPANPPEYAGQYPDPNLWGEVPASGVYLRHADGITFTRTAIGVSPSDARPLTVAVDVTKLAAPTCDVTFVLRTDVDEPVYDPTSDSFRLLGVTAPPAGIASLSAAGSSGDPLGNWVFAAGLALTKTTPDASGRYRFTGHASFPQGSIIDYKAVVGQGVDVKYERDHLGNRANVVPVATSGEIDLDWVN